MFKSLKLSAVFSLLFGAVTVFGSETPLVINDLKHLFSVEIPRGFRAAAPADAPAEAALVIVPEGGGFPNANILAVPGRYDLQSPVDVQLSRILESYRSYGMIDAAAQSAAIEYTSSSAALVADITYTSEAGRMHSAVAYVTAADRHFIITWVGRNGTDDVLGLLRRMLSSFAVKNREAAPPDTEISEIAGKRILTVVLIFMVMAGLLWNRKLFRKERS